MPKIKIKSVQSNERYGWLNPALSIVTDFPINLTLCHPISYLYYVELSNCDGIATSDYENFVRLFPPLVSDEDPSALMQALKEIREL